MKLQTYTLIAPVDIGEPLNVGDTVYEWPYEKWHTMTNEEVCIFVRPRDVTTVYFVPASCLKLGPVAEVRVSIGAMTKLQTASETVRIATDPEVSRSDRVRIVAGMLCASYWRGYYMNVGLVDEGLIRQKMKAHLDDWIPAARMALA